MKSILPLRRLRLAALLLAGLATPPLQAVEPPSSATPAPLWPHGAPGALGTTPKDIPTLTPYLPAKPNATRAAMLLIPGGSYSGIYEGQAEPFALWLNAQGITTFVLRYRLGSAGYRYPAQLQDAVEAMRQIRGNAEKWKIDPQRLASWASPLAATSSPPSSIIPKTEMSPLPLRLRV